MFAFVYLCLPLLKFGKLTYLCTNFVPVSGWKNSKEVRLFASFLRERLPMVDYFLFHNSFVFLFTWWVQKVIFEAQVTNLMEPGFRRYCGVVDIGTTTANKSIGFDSSTAQSCFLSLYLISLRFNHLFIS